MRLAVQDRLVSWPSERTYRALLGMIIATVIIGLAVLLGPFVQMLVRGNFMSPADYTAGTGAWLTEQHWCPDGSTIKPQDRFEQWLTFGRGYPIVVVAGGTADGPFAYTIFRDVPPGPEFLSAVWADTNGNGRFDESDGPIHHAVLCPTGLADGSQPMP